MGLFYAVAGVLALATALILARPLLAGRTRTESRDARDAELYRDQLAELDRDVARGTISPDEAEGARAEVSRRLIAATHRADEAEPLHQAPRRLSMAVAVAAAVGVPLLGAAFYLVNGAPGMPDLPFASRPGEVIAGQRPTQAEAEKTVAAQSPAAPAKQTPEQKQYADLIAKLEKIVAKRPNDVEGHRLLANGYMRLGRSADAWRAYRDLIKLLGDKAGPDLYTAQIDAMVTAAGGYVSPKAEALLATMQKRFPDQAATRYYTGLMAAQQGDLARAIGIWEKLRADAPKGAAWAGFLDSMLAEARRAQAGGGAPAAPAAPPAPGAAPTAPGPSQADVKAAQQMTPAQRQAMIESMVKRLEDRLTTQGGSVGEWVRLMNAYKQLGRPDDAKRVYALGEKSLTGSEAGALREQALLMGVISK